ncbi:MULTISPECIES: LysR substrate-binding domain-containing protein [unclassified Burkholderia]|uniref:LysR substrate-binding domain-containing protein n=1 Tax=unclassified Burkholderia TaxID=2613784 RepID=UPI000F567C67|nr:MULTISPECIES: LysR substrate-binding domain-containing protein [unclassified Burkholderia]RQR35856.1 LysR family transcriptional regulator [Burkholderia sp. Bp9131]RQR69012.1 LysR family transcriptional regulator [Burkholderia sp. Bp9015]RQS04281.1 LysR family transcriptional regulator [Burkholderia sp. Bp8991]RQS29795.1 LysR family transcriptional regulator [Burkholderia sp. Bp8995]RQS36607.1 LysR family transcriptional regulator [Burkholderia sp. Bp8990]
MKTTLDEMLAFVTIADTGSLTGAADKLHQPTSVMSRILRRLEEKLDTTLIRRTTRRLEVTEEGTLFLEYAREIIASVEFAEEQLASQREKPAGRLRINAAMPFMQHVIAPMMPGFREAFPAIAAELHTSDEIIDLLEQRADVAIRIGELRDSTLHARKLGSSRLRILASPAYLEKAGVPTRVADLADHTLLGFVQPETLNHWPLRTADGDVYRIHPALQASSGETLLTLALNGAGIVCLADYMTGTHRRDGSLVEVLVDDTTEFRQPIHAVYYRNATLSSRIVSFLDYLSAQLKEGGDID